MVVDLHDLKSKPNDSPWIFLIARPHAWRRQLWLKGRHQTVSQLVKSMRANNLTPEEAANDFDLPIDAVHEALLYFEKNRDLIRLESAKERRRLNERGLSVKP